MRSTKNHVLSTKNHVPSTKIHVPPTKNHLSMSLRQAIYQCWHGYPWWWYDFFNDGIPLLDSPTPFTVIFTSYLCGSIPILDGGTSIFNDCMLVLDSSQPYSTKAQFSWMVKRWYDLLAQIVDNGTAFLCLDHSNKIIIIFCNLILLNMLLSI